ncbi:hypothetical protein [Metaclostridioides mangenotii]|uniref:hypothetical protein n=1 Tax=Metaclostridioides mangenotii TaxID=1540 RepID=UPI0028EE889F|nr:hypothetical protein [Clostridioides mangenotii]
MMVATEIETEIDIISTVIEIEIVATEIETEIEIIATEIEIEIVATEIETEKDVIVGIDVIVYTNVIIGIGALNVVVEIEETGGTIETTVKEITAIETIGIKTEEDVTAGRY